MNAKYLSNVVDETGGNSPIAGKPNFLITSRHKFSSIHEYRLFLAMLYLAYDGADITKPLDIDISFIVGNDRGGHDYELLKQACTHIMGEVIDLSNNPKKFKLRHIVDKADFDETLREGRLRVSFHEDVVPYILSMFKEGRFTKIFLKHALPIRSLYSVRLYELLLQNKYLGFKKFTIEELRHYLDIPDKKFVQWQSVKQRIIEPAKQHLKQYTDIFFEYKSIKRGAKVVFIEFEIFPNIPNYNPDSEQLNLFSNIDTKDSIDDVSEHVKIVREYIWKESQENILKNYSPQRIIFYYKHCKKLKDSGKNIADFNSFLFKAICDDRENFETKIVQNQKKIEKKREEEQNRLAQNLEEEIRELKAEKYFRILPQEIRDKYINKHFRLPESIREVTAVADFLAEMESTFQDDPDDEEFLLRINQRGTAE
jgi:hypothetical protein